MKRNVKALLLIIAVLLFLAFTQGTAEDLHGFKVKCFPYYIYQDSNSRINHYFPAYMTGDFRFLRLNERYDKNVKSGNTCLEISLISEQKKDFVPVQVAFPPVPANRWFNIRGGDDLTTARRLFFWARGDEGNEKAEFKMIGLNGKNKNSKISTGTITLSKEWQIYALDLSDTRLEDIAGGLAVVIIPENKNSAQNKYTIYLDQIYYTDSSQPLQVTQYNGLQRAVTN